MPYKNAGYIVVSSKTKSELDEYRRDEWSWDAYMNEILKLIKKEAGEESSQKI